MLTFVILIFSIAGAPKLEIYGDRPAAFARAQELSAFKPAAYEVTVPTWRCRSLNSLEDCVAIMPLQEGRVFLPAPQALTPGPIPGNLQGARE